MLKIAYKWNYILKIILLLHGGIIMDKTIDLDQDEEKRINQDLIDKHVKKGKIIAGKVANDFGKTMEDIVLNLKSIQKDVDSKINEYKENSPVKIDIDLVDAGSVYYLKADLPGVKKDSVDIEIAEKDLTIKAFFGSICDDLEEDCHDNCEFLIKGRKFGSAERTVTLPKKIKIEESEAKFKNGILFLTLPQIESTKIKLNLD
jgi:HSP20 family protein